MNEYSLFRLTSVEIITVQQLRNSSFVMLRRLCSFVANALPTCAMKYIRTAVKQLETSPKSPLFTVCHGAQR